MATGHGSSFSFGTSGITLNVISIDPPQESVEDVAKPHLGLDVGDYVPYDPGELVEGGEYTIEFEDDLDTNIPVGVKETMTWTKPVPAGSTNGATWAFPGYIKSAKQNQQQTAQRATISAVVKVAGEVTKTAAS